jgi:Flp pilus assembly protein TadB
MDVIQHIRWLGLEVVAMMVVAYIAVGWWRVQRRRERRSRRDGDVAPPRADL